ncbi:hypothetical protein [Paenibacillus sp. Marseille-Q4541]|uniref:hypothetical protein n=1 Tax=Paenibacillus sp. Marseille-Q4541 TaxID=2831522 RepID=UPI001BAB9FED|nr:hypothetical protein [Paenibacillus sp. Marseille-Q4541]
MIFFDLDETLFDFKSAEYLAVNFLFTQFPEQSICNSDDFYNAWCAIGKRHFGRFLLGELSFEEQKIERVKELFHFFELSIDGWQSSTLFSDSSQSF